MATTLASWAIAVRDTLRAMALDADALLRAAGLDPATLHDVDARIPVERTARLWALAVETSGDPAFGLQVARHTTPATFHALGVSLPASATVAQALQRLVRYFAVVTEVAELALQSHGERTTLAIRAWPLAPPPAPEAVDALASLVVRLGRALAGRDFAPRAVQLRRATPADPAPWLAALRAPVQFDASADQLVFDSARLSQPLPQANERLARSYDQVAARHLAQLSRADTTAQVRRALCRELAAGEPAAAQIARMLHLSLRTLQRRLAAEGTTFGALLDRTRHELALAYLGDGDYGIGEIAYLLGFAQAASFTHACRRWTGMSPRALRAARATGSR
jgi:AraC-like DNA-binding protein